MKTEKINIRFGIIVLIILAAALSRLIPHPPNFTPIGAMAIFGAAYFSNRLFAFAVPLLSMWLSDLVINNTIYAHHWNNFWIIPDSFPFNYFALLLTVPLGLLLLRKIKVGHVIIASISAATLFFLISNFGVWLSNPIYPQNLLGLISCYGVAIPFFGNTLAGNLFYTAVLFGNFELAKNKFPVLQIQKT